MDSLDPEDSGQRTPLRRGSTTASAVNASDPPTVVSGTPSGASTHVTDPAAHSLSADRTEAGKSQDWMPVAGARVGNYELGPPIGVGGMATVYVAQDLSLERTVALKILPPKSAQDAEVLQRFLLEGKAAARLDHPNIARIFALGHDGSYYFLAFEYVEGRTVRQWIDERRRIDIDQALEWSIQTAKALAHADRRGVVHRDIKPSNLIVTPGGQVKLVDLGLARRYESQGQVDLTQSGTTLGTFDYISPEQARDPRNVDVRSDLYSLGCTMFHMLTGTPPFPGQNVVQKLLHHQEKPAPDIRGLNPEVPESLADLIARLMSKSPADRPASADSCVKQLEAIRDEIAARALAGNPEVEPNSIRGLLTWLVPATVLTLAITVGAWLASGMGTDRDTAPETEGNTIADAQPVEKEPEARSKAEPIVPRALVTDAALRKPPTTYRVKDGPGLAQAFRESTPGSVIVLSESVRYELDSNEIPLLDKTDLTLRGESGTRPVLVAAIPGPDELPGSSVLGLIRARESRMTVQNVTFDLGASTGDWLESAIFAENCDLTLRDVLFLADSTPHKTSRQFIRIGKSEYREDSAWRPLRIENCRFLGNRVAIAGRGALDITVYDSAVLGSEPLIDIADTDRDTPWPCMIRIEHVNFQATASTPVLRLGNGAVAVRVRNSVFAPKPGVRMNLVSSRRPSRVDWFGRENLYGDMSSFMESLRVEEEIVDFAEWSHAENAVREQSSLATKRFVYGPVESVALANEGRWADAFALNRGPWSEIPVGVRAWSDRIATARERADAPEVALSKDTRKDAALSGNGTGRGTESRSTSEFPSEAQIVAKIPAEDRGTSILEPVPMPMPMQAEPAEATAKSETVKAIATKSEEASVPGRSVDAVTKDLEPANRQIGEITQPKAEAKLAIRTADEFRKALSEPAEAQGSTVILAAGAVIRIDSQMALSEGRWLIAAQAGAVRPRIVFEGQNRALVENRARWTIEKAANLRLRGIDIEWTANEAGGERLFDVAAGTQAVFEACALTAKQARNDLTFFAAIPGDLDDFADRSNARSNIRLIDSVIRTSGGMLRCPGDLRCEFEISGCLAVIGRPLITILAPERLQPSQSSRVQVNQSTLVLGSSLAIVNLGRTQAERPHLEFQVRRSILAGNALADHALIDVQGADPDEEVSDCVAWDGDEVAYHQWSTYRTDRNNLSGMLARRQNREEWQLSHTLQDHEPIHGDVDFSGGDFWEKNTKTWEAAPDDFSVAKGSSASGLGASIDRLPRVASATPAVFDSNGFEP